MKRLPRVLAVPGGGSSVHDYYPELAELLIGRAELFEADPPELDVAAGRQWLKPPDHARFLAGAVRRDGDDPVVVVGHSLGALVALRLALDHRELVAGLLLLDPSPPIFGLLLPRPLLRLAGMLRRLVRRSSRRPVPPPRALSFATRVRWYMSATFPLAADLTVTDLGGIPTVVVSAGEHQRESLFGRSHARLTDAIPGARLEVWSDTTHGLHAERPHDVAAGALALLEAA
jgi:pimeloyl-ACP methyl ester carboxylesterase